MAMLFVSNRIKFDHTFCRMGKFGRISTSECALQQMGFGDHSHKIPGVIVVEHCSFDRRVRIEPG